MRIRLAPLVLLAAAALFLGGLVGATKVLIGLAFHSGGTCVSYGSQRHCGTDFEVQFHNGKMVVLHPGQPGYYDYQTGQTVAPAPPVCKPDHGDGCPRGR